MKCWSAFWSTRIQLVLRSLGIKEMLPYFFLSIEEFLWKILKEMGVPDHLTCLLRNVYAGQEATVRTEHGTTVWFKIRKGVHQGCILSPCLFNLYAQYIKWNAGLDEVQAGIKIPRRNINNLSYADDTTLTTKSEKELNSFLMSGERREWKSCLKNSTFKKLRSWHLVLSLHGKQMGKKWK